MTKEKRLGRGLDALLSKPGSETSAIMGAEDDADALRPIAIELLQRGKYQHASICGQINCRIWQSRSSRRVWFNR